MFALYTQGLFGRGTYSSALRHAGLDKREVRAASRELRSYVVYWIYAALSDSGLLKEIEGSYRRRIRRSVRNPALLDAILDLLLDADVLRSYEDIFSFEAEPDRPTLSIWWLKRALTGLEDRFSQLAEDVRSGMKPSQDPAHTLAMYDNPLTLLETGLAVEGFGLGADIGALLLPWSGLGEYVFSLRSILGDVRIMAAAPPGLERVVRLALRTRGVYEGGTITVFSAGPEVAGLECLKQVEGTGTPPEAALLLNAIQWSSSPEAAVRSAVTGVRSGGRVYILQTLRSSESLPMVILGRLLGGNLLPTWEELERSLRGAGVGWRVISRTGSAVALEVTTGVR